MAMVDEIRAQVAALKPREQILYCFPGMEARVRLQVENLPHITVASSPWVPRGQVFIFDVAALGLPDPKE